VVVGTVGVFIITGGATFAGFGPVITFGVVVAGFTLVGLPPPEGGTFGPGVAIP